MPGRLSNKVALITGASRGIGKAIALKFAQEGADVIITARKKNDIDTTIDKIRKIGSRGIGIEIDLGDKESIASVVNTVQSSFSSLHILVNNVGIGSSQNPKSIEDYDDDFWERSIYLNLTVPYLLTKAFSPMMIAQKYGRIINISSSAGKKGFSYASAYCASKHGLIGLTKATALDLAKTGVTVNSICPGPIRTEMLQARLKIEAEKEGKTIHDLESSRTPMGRILEPEEVAQLALFLSSEESSGMTGQAVNVSAGSVMH
ncbi:SDR family oxidoreductase [uncultured Desulfosarcina sp.]|uniref:SDR family NAD(P)-dependent oxidoreductase n=1 Tax=uncultured Desulfosarcina sp. TaxID=218289 RepID=UPI0029C6A8D2|nr:SDR family oxidoreductase [uncultured Desulfosarcina sp.]